MSYSAVLLICLLAAIGTDARRRFQCDPGSVVGTFQRLPNGFLRTRCISRLPARCVDERIAGSNKVCEWTSTSSKGCASISQDHFVVGLGRQDTESTRRSTQLPIKFHATVCTLRRSETPLPRGQLSCTDSQLQLRPITAVPVIRPPTRETRRPLTTTSTTTTTTEDPGCADITSQLGGFADVEAVVTALEPNVAYSDDVIDANATSGRHAVSSLASFSCRPPANTLLVQTDNATSFDRLELLHGSKVYTARCDVSTGEGTGSSEWLGAGANAKKSAGGRVTAVICARLKAADFKELMKSLSR